MNSPLSFSHYATFLLSCMQRKRLSKVHLSLIKVYFSLLDNSDFGQRGNFPGKMRNQGPGLSSHLFPRWHQLHCGSGSFFRDAQGAKGSFMQMESILNQMGTVFGMTGTQFFNVQTSWGCLRAPCVVKITLVSSFHLESLFTVRALLLKELLEQPLISVTLS